MNSQPIIQIILKIEPLWDLTNHYPPSDFNYSKTLPSFEKCTQLMWFGFNFSQGINNYTLKRVS
jgi:hypothetical protein